MIEKQKQRSFNHDSLLYQEIPSLEPRVSRRERISQQGPADCPECSQKLLSNARQSTRFSYWLFLVLLVISFGIIQFLKITDNREKWLPYQKEHRIYTVNKNQKISASLINQEDRYGLSLLFRNTQTSTWNINYIKIALADEMLYETNINISMSRDKIYTTFIKLPKEIYSLEKINVDIK
ncbi:MAG: hypothetical protein ACRCTJ_05590 [Brevinema sp.]